MMCPKGLTFWDTSFFYGSFFDFRKEVQGELQKNIFLILGLDKISFIWYYCIK